MMISEEEACAKILGAVRALPPRQVPILRALDCFAAEDYFARLPLPNFDNSSMDGYAVIANDCRRGAKLRVIGEQPAGADRQLRVSAGETVRIFTGAPIPGGADAVVMQEDVTRSGDKVVVNVDVDPGEFVRKRGCDLSEGQRILRLGERIHAAAIGLLASQGFADISVGGQVHAAIVSGGDELANPGERLQPGQIYDSNSLLLQALVERCGAIVGSSQHCSDDAEALENEFRAAIKSKVLIVSGGVSVGEHDLVQTALRSLGAKIDIWRVAIKPGKPFLFGSIDDCFVFGLPGNPVSAFVTFLQFVRPAILKMMGATGIDLPRVLATVSVDLTNASDRVHYVRGKFVNGEFMPVGRQESHALFGLSQSNALLRLEQGEEIRRGATVQLQLFN